MIRKYDIGFARVPARRASRTVRASGTRTLSVGESPGVGVVLRGVFSASQNLSRMLGLMSEKSKAPALAFSGASSFRLRNELTMVGRSSMSRMTMSAPRPFLDFLPCSSSRACVSSRSSCTCEPPTYPTIKAMSALAAEPTPETESSTAMHESTSMPSAAAALRYTSGRGLYLGGSKSLCPLWILSSGKNSDRPAVSTHAGTRGLGDVVLTQYLNPEILRKFRALITPLFALASALSASNVSSRCFSSNVAWSSRHISSGFKPSPARSVFTTWMMSKSSAYFDRALRSSRAPPRRAPSPLCSTSAQTPCPRFAG